MTTPGSVAPYAASMTKLGARSRAHLGAKALGGALIEPGTVRGLVAARRFGPCARARATGRAGTPATDVHATLFTGSDSRIMGPDTGE